MSDKVTYWAVLDKRTDKKTWAQNIGDRRRKNMGPKCFTLKIIELFNLLSFVSMSRAGWPWFLAVGSCPDYTRSLVTACHPPPKMHHGMIGPGPSWVQSLTIHKQRQLVEPCLHVPLLSQSWVSIWGALFSTNMTPLISGYLGCNILRFNVASMMLDILFCMTL